MMLRREGDTFPIHSAGARSATCWRHRQVDVHVLAFGEAVDHATERELAADAALLDPAIGLPERLAAALVHLHPARLDRVGGAKRPTDIVGPDVGGKAVVA